MYTKESPVRMSADDYATGTNEVLTIIYAAAGRGLQHVISGIAWSHSAAPAAGATVLIQDGTTTIFALGMAAAGPFVVNFTTPKFGLPNTPLTVTLTAGGAGVVSHLNVLGHWLE